MTQPLLTFTMGPPPCQFTFLALSIWLRPQGVFGVNRGDGFTCEQSLFESCPWVISPPPASPPTVSSLPLAGRPLQPYKQRSDGGVVLSRPDRACVKEGSIWGGGIQKGVDSVRAVREAMCKVCRDRKATLLSFISVDVPQMQLHMCGFPAKLLLSISVTFILGPVSIFRRAKCHHMTMNTHFAQLLQNNGWGGSLHSS